MWSILFISMISVFLVISGKANANSSNSSTQNTWIQQTPTIRTSDLTFLQAVKLGERDVVAKKLKQGANVDDRQDGHYSPLFFASAKGYSDIVQMLIQYGANPNMAGRGGWTPLMVAAMHGQAKNITLLLNAGANPEFQNAQGKTALMVAIEFDKIDIVNQFIQRGVNVNARSDKTLSKGRSVLSLATEHGNVDIVKILLSAGAHVNNKVFNNESPIAYAIRKGHQDALVLLLDYSSKIQKEDAAWRTSVRNVKRNSALHYAAEYGTPDILRLLLASGEKPNQENNIGRTALTIAARAGRMENVEMLASSASKEEIQEVFHVVITTGLTEGVNKILALGANVNAANSQGETPLMLAVENRHHLIVDLLLVKGANVQAVSNEGDDALMLALATMPSKQRIVTALIENGANPHRKNLLGNTALHVAAKHCAGLDFSVAETLVNAGAKQDEVNNKNKRARDLVADSCLHSKWGQL